MKILAIRGKNLASLGEFTLDFQSEPLAGTGLFAITGPTGSGKSTLLDALCLALYEQTPRLSAVVAGTSLTDVGANSITQGDVRSILRRGCSDGYAEVDFIGCDNSAYRSRWTVRRARAKADGKLQQSEMSFVRIRDGQALGDHRKSETLRIIETYVGLSFAQFTRAVLLAQNDFTAFLKASDDARAELLQTLTGTENYAKISMLAFERAKQEKEKLAQLQQLSLPLALVTPEQSAEKALQLHMQSQQIASWTVEKSAIENRMHWYRQLDQLSAEQLQAEQALTMARAAETEAAARADALAQLEKLQSARPLCAELVRVKHAQTDAANGHALAQTALLHAQAALDVLVARQNAASNEYDIAELARNQAQPDIDAAKALDARIATIAPQVATAQREYDAAVALVAAELSQQADANAQLQSDQSKLELAQQWLAGNDALRRLAEAWPRWELLLAQAHKTLQQQAQVDTHVADLTQALAGLENGFIDARAVQDLALHAFTQANVAFEHCSADCAAFDMEQLLSDRAALERSFEHLQSAQNLWEKQIDSQRQKQVLERQVQQQTQTRDQNQEVVRAGLQALPLLECAVRTANESLQLASLAASESAERMRTALQPDQPCPVCGARAHPYAAHAPESNVLQSVQNLLSAKQKALHDTEIQIASADLAAQRSIQAIAEAEQLLAVLAQAQAALNAQWAGHPMHPDLDSVPELQRAQNLADRQGSIRQGLEQVRAQDARYRQALKDKEVAQKQLDAVRNKRAQADAELAQLDSQRAAVYQNLARAQRDQADLSAQLASDLSQLDVAFPVPIWRAEWHKNPNAFARQKQREVMAWAAHVADVAALTARIAELKITSSACEKACLRAQDLQTNRGDLKTSLRAEIQRYQDLRTALFAGKPLAQVETALNAALQRAKNVRSETERLLQDARAKLAVAEDALSQSKTRLDLQRHAADVAQLSLDAWLVQFNSELGAGAQNLAWQELITRLEIAPDWIANERTVLQDLKRDVQSAEAVLDARRHSCSAHRAEQPNIEALAVLQEQNAHLQKAIDACSDTVAALKIEIALDASSLTQAAALRIKIDKQSADAKVWSQLGELIGSADGKKFRNFAQQLTLDILLNYANVHLQTLTRRYRVQRIKDSLGLTVVDQDMGDEVRSVHSLSGGESFLLSLALALGLASLSSHRVQVESLFIDEGFGSLDAESLEIAMDALDNLQSQGRKVGVISHLQEMTERIGVNVQVQRLAAGLSKIVVV